MDNKKRAGANIAFWLAAVAILLLACGTTSGATMGAAIVKMPPKRPQNADTLKPTQTPTPSPQRCIVTAGYLNFRACGATSCDVIEVLEEGDRLTVINAGSWYHVKTDDGAPGYVKSTYCEIAEVQNE